MQSSLFQKRHYIALAEALHSGIAPTLNRLDVARDIADMLARDNPNFDRGRFMHAVETGEVLGRRIAGGVAVGQYGYEGGHRYDRKLRR